MKRTQPILIQIFFLLAVFILIAPAPVVFSDEIAVFLSGDLEAYQSALAGAKKVIKKDEISEFNMMGDQEKGEKIIPQIKQKNPGAVLAIGVRAVKLAIDGLPGLPIVYCLVFNPFELGLVGGNLTGVAMITSPKSQFEKFQDALPSLQRLGVLYDPDKSLKLIEEAREAASQQGINLVERSVTSPKEIASALKDIISNIDALWLLPDTTVVNKDVFAYFLKVTIENRRPIFAFSDGLVKSGALLSYSPGYEESGIKAGEEIILLIHAASANRSNLVYPSGRLYINSKTADALGIKIPDWVMRKAEKVF